MQKLKLPLLVTAILILFCVNLFGLMKMLPLIITAPLLFAAITALLVYVNGRNRFRGFRPPSARRHHF
ncbi:hypothetical protein [Heyndrickxia acidiproducens]|uniref:hypothetical protein n=1 Tax=Heyndrickxia acidiproducens TaxID=1121084 RepID=UPI000371F06D|nr:hypothetical protein [Heyndrickxia acidiproducens]